MKIDNNPLWKKIEIFSIDPPDVHFTFTQRLARENSWSEQFASEVVLEYKKFIFLCASQDLPCTPSDAVDQAWHLHLSYTKSYWTDLCENLLGKKLHHNPTQGGQSEADKFINYYESTLSLYRTNFESEPPENIWPSSAIRFGSNEFIRVDPDHNYVIRKKRWHAPAAMLVCFGIIALITKQYQIMYLGGFGAFLVYNAPNFKKNSSDGCSGGCSAGCSDGHQGDSGCSGGHHGGSGCSSDGGCSSGCSGCGGGD